jgi:predicted TPR repeat methyltransferase
MSGPDETALDRVLRARAITGADEARSLYGRWADTYDEDVYGTLKVTGTMRVVELLACHLNPADNPAILDAGCGTGAVGAHSYSHGFHHIDGIDISPEMLAVAARRKVYGSLIEADLNQPLPPALGRYDAVASAGTFVHGHVGREGFISLSRLLRGGGLMVCAISDAVWTQGGFDRLLPDLKLEPLSHTCEVVIPGGQADTHLLVARLTTAT